MPVEVNGFNKTAFAMGTVGAEHPAELVRTANHAFSNGGRGVVEPLDLWVSQLPIATGKVRMNPGAVIIGNTTPMVQSESYIGRAPGESIITVPFNGSGTRYDLIGVRIKDPEYGSFPSPPNEVEARTWEYIEPFHLVNATAAQIQAAREDRPFLTFPVEWTTLVTLPPNTGTITRELLTDLRKLAQPKSYIDLIGTGFSDRQSLIGPDADAGKVWPEYRPLLKVPYWTTQGWVAAQLNSVGQQNAATQGYLTCVLGGLRAQNVVYDEDAPQVGGSRRYYTVFGRWDNLTSLAGKTVELRLEGRKINHTQNPGYLEVLPFTTQLSFQYGFKQDILSP